MFPSQPCYRLYPVISTKDECRAITKGDARGI